MTGISANGRALGDAFESGADGDAALERELDKAQEEWLRELSRELTAGIGDPK